ncbi:probable RNA-binding protein ARP1 isoform X1 [Dendrobium catenatum]|uniref:Glycine-rich RNA-binding protein 2, mitochondrial n=1 Tax=Dendrobium catenatum TaxID=906689 RepID=A0A2I0W0L9_9ASPA|nr:probable RNA-binding protein ARP1 isoform X2 [Dendrobium catenatum]XP_020685775.1 probable RNA-binding protein ARP1 isoform X1 [Dendrobium catenatum]PKU69204.1 Glycine-rich RNA-binding protein 2, mitochondrial [Dendrobium catenatum]
MEGQQQPQPSSPADTALTKVFVGGLAWETQTEVLRDYFRKFGDIIEAVIITDKLTGRSKGYGFVTFKEAEAAKKACEDSAPVINGRKGNCNLASLGARRVGVVKISPPATPAAAVRPAAAAAVVPWYFPAGKPPSSPTMPAFHQHYPAGALPFYTTAYGYSPSYLAPTNMGYTTKVSHSDARGAYLPGQFSYATQGGLIAPVAMTPIYHPIYEFNHNHHLPHSMAGVAIPSAPAQFFPPVTTVSYGPAPSTHASRFPIVAPSKC